jgi:diaminopimelate epimerase
MEIHFYKYHGTGNDFIILDNRNLVFDLTQQQIAFLCHRHFGIGADGLMLLNSHTDFDFEMVYYNSDGKQSSMCGNGGRCIVAFAKKLNLIENNAHFIAIDGEHFATLNNDIISLKMNDVNSIKINETYFELHTGSPHYVAFSDYTREMDIKKEGALIRYSPLYKDMGINVNFVEIKDDKTIFARTYERGVEDETLSCGTGVTACALINMLDKNGSQEINIETLGGNLIVQATNNNNTFTDVYLIGEATFVFEGNITIV